MCEHKKKNAKKILKKRQIDKIPNIKPIPTEFHTQKIYLKKILFKIQQTKNVFVLSILLSDDGHIRKTKTQKRKTPGILKKSYFFLLFYFLKQSVFSFVFQD